MDQVPPSRFPFPDLFRSNLEQQFAERLRHLCLRIVTRGQLVIRPPFTAGTFREWIEHHLRRIPRLHTCDVRAMKRVSRVRGRLHGLRETSDAEVREPAANELACRTFLEPHRSSRCSVGRIRQPPPSSARRRKVFRVGSGRMSMADWPCSGTSASTYTRCAIRSRTCSAAPVTTFPPSCGRRA
jgi:hypothetical protein